jgi:3-oxoacyl-[acyl-carrier protein] reductase
MTSEPEVAALALYLASKRGRNLSGHVFDAEGVAPHGEAL